jgi:hypothetical protein
MGVLIKRFKQKLSLVSVCLPVGSSMFANKLSHGRYHYSVERYYLSSDCFISFAWSLEGKFVSFLSTFFANCFFSLLVLGT